MPFDDPDMTDPMSFHAIEVETDNLNSLREMAVCFVEEYARMGFSAERIMALFQRNDFAGPALAYRELGSSSIAEIIEAQISLRGPRGVRRSEIVNQQGNVELPILD